ncbi:hypothetical protein GN958_ATG05747 [Phytophthora infestans]|uniref:Uncharacterized protein n=1 Tax=Phytophthora infestans TaxID=4787 RepID=A0A8S9UWJ1_PHYIN|nr:hypothetical protein GN958_ATG05747 [Phytophthora infestans]
MASIAAPDKRRKKPPLLLLDARTSSDFPTGSSESFVVPELPMAFDMSANSNASTASEMTSTSSSASASSSNRGVKWWKRVTAMRAKRRRSGSKQESRPSLDQELYVRSILESYASSMSSNNRYSTSNPQPSVGESSSSNNSSKKSNERTYLFFMACQCPLCTEILSR